MPHIPSTPTILVGNAVLREGLAALLQHSPYKVVASGGRASNLTPVNVALDRQAVAILTMDGGMGSSAEAADDIRALRTQFTHPTIVLVAETRRPVDIQQIAMLTPNVFISDLTSRELLLKVLDLSTAAEMVLVLSSFATDSISKHLTRPDPPISLGINGHRPTTAVAEAFDDKGPQFSQRERQILCQLARGRSNKEIARQFAITESTVKVHLKALLRKIGARNRTQAALWAVANGHHGLPTTNDRIVQMNEDTSVMARNKGASPFVSSIKSA